MIFFQGFAVGGGLIIAIGAQNAFVLSQGIRRRHYIVIPAICSICDALLIALGISGMGSLVAMNPGLTLATAWGGATLLFWYGLNSFRSMISPSTLTADTMGPDSVKGIILTTLGLTLLNPHVYLDTVVLIGSIGSRFPGYERILFGAGAAAASVIWFFSLSLGGKILAPLFQKPLSWKILDMVVGITMWAIAVSLVMHPGTASPPH